MNRCEPVWTALRFYVVVAFSWAKVLKSVWTGLNRFVFFFGAKAMKRFEPVWTGLCFLEQKPWIGLNRFEPLYAFTLLWHFRGLKSLNRFEPVWTGLCFFEQRPWNGVNRFEPVYVFFEQKPWNGVNRFEPLYVFTLLWHFPVLKSLYRSEPVWTA